MTDQEINIKVAEACGWTDIGISGPYNTACGRWMGRLLTQLPDYCNDLNTMHEAEKTLRRAPDTFQPGGIGYYLRLLDESVGEPITATARQRAETFLRTVGKWKD